MANFARMFLLSKIPFFQTNTDIPVFIVVCLAMVGAVIVAKTIGCSLPILAKLLHLDPALMAGPMITTIVDAVTLLIYFGIATAFIANGILMPNIA